MTDDDQKPTYRTCVDNGRPFAENVKDERWLKAYTDDILAGLDWQKVRPEVRAFALLMEKQLQANDHKSGWKDGNPKALIGRLIDETHELIDIANSPFARSPATTRRMGREAADVANFAMMIADVAGALGDTKCAN